MTDAGNDELLVYGLETMKGLSCLEHINTWINNSERTQFQITHRLTIHSHTKTDLQRAYILLLILVVWHWQPLDG